MSVSIPVYNHLDTVLPVSGNTPFGYYDNDSQFQSDAPKFVIYSTRKLGYPIVEIELQQINFYAALEDAVTTYAKELYEYKIRENYLSLEGTSTGSSLNDAVIVPSLGTIIKIAKTYGSEAGVGGETPYYTGSVKVTEGRQRYDLNEWAAASASLSPGDSIEIKRVYYRGVPAISRYFDPYAGTGTDFQYFLDSFGYGMYSPGVQFLLMPVYHDVLKLQAIEFNDQIRRSNYSFELVNNQLKIFPIPARETNLYFDYIKVSERNSSIHNIDSSGSIETGYITNVGNVPYTDVSYSSLNAPAKQWIMHYALANVKDALGNVRNKYSQIPFANDEQVVLNGQQLIDDGKNEKEFLIEKLREMLDDSSRSKQLEKKANDSRYIKETLTDIPMLIYVG